jgi:hypothetical protein
LESYRETLPKVRLEVDQALKEGRISVHRMSQIAKLPEDKQVEAVKDWEKIRAEHPEAFERKRGRKTAITDFARWFEGQSDAEKERVWRIANVWKRAHRGAA